MDEVVVTTALVWVILILGVLTAVATTVLMHYFGLSRLNRRLGHMAVPRRSRPLYAIFGVIGLHAVEILIFALAGFLLEFVPGIGRVVGTSGVDAGGFFDVLYLSSVSYTTIGFGEVVPTGPLRALFAVEGLIGLTLITWSASFTYLEMERDWRR